jgi:hypothetical protein
MTNNARYYILKAEWNAKTKEFIDKDFGGGYSENDVKDICKGYSLEGLRNGQKIFYAERKNTMTFFSIRKEN